jgi:hypothetical protein
VASDHLPLKAWVHIRTADRHPHSAGLAEAA